MTLRELQKVYGVCKELEKIAKKLHRYNELYCNYGELTKNQLTREVNLEKQAQALASQIGFVAVRQGDPRGGSLFLAQPEDNGKSPEEITKMLYIEY